MGTWLNKGKVGGDLVIDELSPIYSRESRTYTNSSGSTKTLAVGQPFTGNNPTVAASISGLDGILLQPISVEDGDTVEVAVLTSAAVINGDALPTYDVADTPAAFNMTTFKTALAAMSIKIVYETTPQEEQTT